MHISEGVLPAATLLGGVVVSIAGIGLGIRSIKHDKIPEVGMMAAAFFAASFVHLPLGPFNMHLVLNGLIGIVLGWAAFPAIFTALLLQAMLFGYGGLSTLGINTAIMAVPAVAVHYLFLFSCRDPESRLASISGFVLGFFAILFSAALLSFSLATNGESFFMLAKLSFGAHLPVMFVEGAITGFAVIFLLKVKPEIFTGSPRIAST